jgi:hypothetical protein
MEGRARKSPARGRERRELLAPGRERREPPAPRREGVTVGGERMPGAGG